MIHRTQLNVKNASDIELEALIGIPQGTDEWVEFNIILNRVDAWREQYKNNLLVLGECAVHISGETYTINTPYKEFDKIMLEFYKEIL